MPLAKTSVDFSAFSLLLFSNRSRVLRVQERSSFSMGKRVTTGSMSPGVFFSLWFIIILTIRVQFHRISSWSVIIIINWSICGGLVHYVIENRYYYYRGPGATHTLPGGGRWFVFLFISSREHEVTSRQRRQRRRRQRQRHRSGASHTCPIPYVGGRRGGLNRAAPCSSCTHVFFFMFPYTYLKAHLLCMVVALCTCAFIIICTYDPEKKIAQYY